MEGGELEGGGGFACGPVLTCFAGEYCLITEGGVVILDASNAPTYKCNKLPATCTSGASCQCVTQVQPTCSCTDMSGGPVVTCQFP